MKRAAAQALVDRNADACEAAANPRCKCACGGALHGTKHSASWRRQQVEALADVDADPQQLTLEAK